MVFDQLSIIAAHSAGLCMEPQSKIGLRSKTKFEIHLASKASMCQSSQTTVGCAEVPPHNLQGLKDLVLTSLCQIPAFFQRGNRVHTSMGQGPSIWALELWF